MSAPWEARLRAVATLANPKPYLDGEVRCAGCRNEKLNRADLACWRCGGDVFEILADELRQSRIPPPPPQPVPLQPVQYAGGYYLPFTLSSQSPRPGQVVPVMTPQQWDEALADEVHSHFSGHPGESAILYAIKTTYTYDFYKAWVNNGMPNEAIRKVCAKLDTVNPEQFRPKKPTAVQRIRSFFGGSK